MDTIRDQTHDDLERNRRRILKKMAKKEQRMEEDFELKKNVLQSNFNENISKLVKDIAT